MIRGAFQHRSGRVIALGRVSIAAFYLLAAAIAPFPEGEATAVIHAVLTAYVLAATAVLVFTWSNWWLEERLGTAGHVMDILVLGLLVTLSRDGYTSPVFVFFIFLVLSAAMRWGWRGAFVTAGVVAFLFALATWVALITPGGEPFEPQRFVIRTANLVVLSLMLAWFGVNYIDAPAGRRADALLDAESGDPPIEKAMRYLAQRLGAARVVFAWTEADDPWLNLAMWEKEEFKQETAGSWAVSSAIAPDLKGRLFLFDSRHGRVLSQESGRHRTAMRTQDAINPELVENFGIDAGIAIPVRAGSLEGELFALNVPGLCPDDLAIAGQIEEEVRAAFERASLLAATEDAVLSRARLSLARDLHDNVAQILAGISLKLRGIRKNAPDAAFVDQQVGIMEQELVQQQQDIRMLIQMLRTPPQESSDIDFRKDLAALTLRLERQWGVDIRLRSVPAAVTLSHSLRHEVNQLVREAVANAVRHGEARVITIAGSRDDEALRLEVADDGSGLGFDGEWDDDEMRESKVGPRSLHERIGSLGGTLKLVSGQQGTRLIITIPNEGV